VPRDFRCNDKRLEKTSGGQREIQSVGWVDGSGRSGKPLTGYKVVTTPGKVVDKEGVDSASSLGTDESSGATLVPSGATLVPFARTVR
jgi:hypothetical protein